MEYLANTLARLALKEAQAMPPLTNISRVEGYTELWRMLGLDPSTIELKVEYLVNRPPQAADDPAIEKMAMQLICTRFRYRGQGNLPEGEMVIIDRLAYKLSRTAWHGGFTLSFSPPPWGHEVGYGLWLPDGRCLIAK
jgi:hypothetical protein